MNSAPGWMREDAYIFWMIEGTKENDRYSGCGILKFGHEFEK